MAFLLIFFYCIAAFVLFDGSYTLYSILKLNFYLTLSKISSSFFHLFMCASFALISGSLKVAATYRWILQRLYHKTDFTLASFPILFRTWKIPLLFYYFIIEQLGTRSFYDTSLELCNHSFVMKPLQNPPLYTSTSWTRYVLTWGDGTGQYWLKYSRTIHYLSLN